MNVHGIVVQLHQYVWGIKPGSVAIIYMYEYIWRQKNTFVNRSPACPFVTVQGVDLNMEPAVEDSAPPCNTLPIVPSTTTRDYQISLIESRGPNSRGV